MTNKKLKVRHLLPVGRRRKDPKMSREEEWQEKARAARERAERVAEAIRERARKVAREAGLDPSIAFLHAHNAQVSADYGKPWPGVNYALVRRVLWLEKQSWVPHRLSDAYARRLYQTVTWGR